MKIAIITMWFNEAFLAPIFFRHYRMMADDFFVILDTDTNDKTFDICMQFGANILPFTFPDGMNDTLKIEKYNKIAKALDHDWIIALDSDEFLHPPPDDFKSYLKNEYDYISVRWWQMYRHKTENALNQRDPVFEQRAHGDPDSFVKWPHQIKPNIVRNKKPFHWGTGHDSISGNDLVEAPFMLNGAHWANADYALAVTRRIYGRRNRMSQYNKDNGFTVHNHHVTEQQIKDLCREHENDPKLF